jgi:hypothetical protein
MHGSYYKLKTKQFSGSHKVSKLFMGVLQLGFLGYYVVVAN